MESRRSIVLSIMFKETYDSIASHTYICLCSAHMLKAVSMRLSRKEGVAKKRKVVLTYFPCLQRCDNLGDVKNLFCNIKLVLCSTENSEQVQRAKTAIMDTITANTVLL